MMFLRVYLICASLDFLLYLAKPTTTIDHSAPVEKWHLERNRWPWPLTLNFDFDLDLETGWKTTKCYVKTRFITVWPWPLTYDLELQSQPSLGQGQPSCQKSRSWVKRFRRENDHWRTDRRTDDPTKHIISLASRSIISNWCRTFSTFILITGVWQTNCVRHYMQGVLSDTDYMLDTTMLVKRNATLE